MSKSQLEYIRHMLDEAEYLLQASQGINYQTFSGNPTLTRAFARSLEVIGKVVIYGVFRVIDARPRIPASLHYPVHCVHFYAPVNEPGRLIYCKAAMPPCADEGYYSSGLRSTGMPCF